MPLVKCADCGREISTAATACPQCGRPNSPVVAVPPMPLSTTEDTLWRGSPSWLLILGRIIWIALTIIVLTSVAYFLRSASPDVERGATMFRVVLIIMGIVVMWQGVFALIAYARIATTIYKLTNQRLTIESGITDKSIEDIDLRYVEDSQFRQKLMERLLGIGNITLVSSDKTAPSYVLRGVQNPRELRELIRSTAYQISQRQLFTRST